MFSGERIYVYVDMYACTWTSQMTQMVKNPPAMQETQVLSLGRKDAQERGMETHSSILAWRIPRTEEPGSPWGGAESDTSEQLTLSLALMHVRMFTQYYKELGHGIMDASESKICRVD